MVRTKILLLLPCVFAFTACSTSPEIGASEFPIAYEVDSGSSDSVLMHFYDPDRSLSMQARRDGESIYAGETYDIEYCNSGLFCVRTRDIETPLVIARDQTEFVYENIDYKVVAIDRTLSNCRNYEATRNSVIVASYQECDGIGLTNALLYDNGNLKRRIDLRSYLGLGYNSYVH